MQRTLPGLSAKVMNERLRKMTGFELLERHVFGEVPPITVQYEFTSLGRQFMPILDEVRRFQQALLSARDQSG